MTLTIETFAGLMSLACTLALGAIVLSVRLQQVPTIKVGLTLMAIGLFASGVIAVKGFDSLNSLWHSALLTRFGLLIAAAGYAWHLFAAARRAR